MNKNLIIVLSLLIFSIGCNVQSTSQKTSHDPKVEIGIVVSELSKSIWIVFQAANGDYWFGSDTNGAYKYDGKIITNYTTSDGLSSNRIRAIQEDKKGNIYISTLEGIDKFDGQDFTKLVPIESKSSNENWALNPDDLWFSILGKNGDAGPCRYDGTHLYQLTFPKHYLADAYYKQFPNKSWSPYDVYYIYEDRKGTMWFGTSNLGICRYDGKTLSWLYEEELTLTPQGGSFGIRSIIEDSKGKFWICNSHYRYTISPEAHIEDDKTLVAYQREKGIAGLKTDDGSEFIYFMSVVEDHQGDLWMATYNQGVYRYDGKKFTTYSVKAGENNVTLFSIYKDRKGELWLGTHENGLYKFNGTNFEKFNPSF